jgi:hypothetical protein
MNVFACAVTPCRVQRGCYTTLKTNAKAIIEIFIDCNSRLFEIDYKMFTKLSEITFFV